VAQASQLASNAADKFNQGAASLIATLPQLEEKLHKTAFETMTPQEQLADIARQRADLDRQKAAIPEGASDEAKGATIKSLQVQYNELLKQELEAKQRIADQDKTAAEQEQKRQIYALETQREVALAAGNEELAETLKEQ